MNALQRTIALLSAMVLLGCPTSMWAADKDKPPKSPPAKPEPASDKHFRIFDGKGKPKTLDALLRRTRNVDVVFLGESHDDPVAHALQARLLRLVHEWRSKQPAPAGPLALSLEMFERDVQFILDEYLAGLITEQHLLAGGRPWNNYKQDYRPLVEYAREKELPVIAANAPRRYVNRVGRLGAASLRDIPDPQRRGLPPLPYAEASPAYAAKFNALMKEHGEKKPASKQVKEAPKPPTPPGPLQMPRADQLVQVENDPRRGLEAQSLWDATMAYSIAEFLMRSPGAQVIHLNGRFHTEKRLGIPDHLLRYRPGTSFLVVTMLSAKSFPKFDAKEMTDLGDFIIVTDPSLPRSYKSEPPKK